MKFAAALFSSWYFKMPRLHKPSYSLRALCASTASLSLLGWNFELQVKNFKNRP